MSLIRLSCIGFIVLSSNVPNPLQKSGRNQTWENYSICCHIWKSMLYMSIKFIAGSRSRPPNNWALTTPLCSPSSSNTWSRVEFSSCCLCTPKYFCLKVELRMLDINESTENTEDSIWSKDRGWCRLNYCRKIRWFRAWLNIFRMGIIKRVWTKDQQ